MISDNDLQSYAWQSGADICSLTGKTSDHEQSDQNMKDKSIFGR